MFQRDERLLPKQHKQNNIITHFIIDADIVMP